MAFCLESVLGRKAKYFAVILVDQQIFSFSVSCKQVGFLVLGLKHFVTDSFKLGFFLHNDSGLQRAQFFSKSDSGRAFTWQEVKSRSKNSSFAAAVNSSSKPLSGANVVPLGSVKESGLLFSHNSARRISVFQGLGSKSPGVSKDRVHDAEARQSSFAAFQRNSSPWRSVFQRLIFPPQKKSPFGNFGQMCAPVPGSKSPSSHWPDNVAAHNRLCVRCLSPNHSRSQCRHAIKCWHCKKKDTFVIRVSFSWNPRFSLSQLGTPAAAVTSRRHAQQLCGLYNPMKPGSSPTRS